MRGMIIRRGHPNRVNVRRNRRYRLLLLDGEAAPVAGGGTYGFTVEDSGLTYQAQAGSYDPDAVAFLSGTPTWSSISCSNADVLTIVTNGAESGYSEIRVNFPGLDTTYYRAIISSSSAFTSWTVTIPGLHTYLASVNGETETMNVEFTTGTGSILDLSAHQHWLIPEQVSSDDRGFDAKVSPGTYDPGMLAPMTLTNTNNALMWQCQVKANGLFTIDSDITPSPTGSVSVEIAGYNDGAPFATNAWNNFDWRASGKTDLYTFFGNNLGTPMLMTLIGPT